MLWKQAIHFFGRRKRWIACLSLLTIVGACFYVARPAKSRTLIPPAHVSAKDAALNAKLQPVSPLEKARIASSFGNLPLAFEPNLGQTDGQVKFLSRTSRYNL